MATDTSSTTARKRGTADTGSETNTRSKKASTSKSTAKKTTSKKTPAKATAKKTTATRSRAQKAPAKKAQGEHPSSPEGRDVDARAGGRQADSARSARAPRAEARPSTSPSKVASRVAEELADLTGKSVEGVTGLERNDEGWTVDVEVVEVRRIPDTTDVLALYEVTTDSDGTLQGYRRLRRYARGTPGEGR